MAACYLTHIVDVKHRDFLVKEALRVLTPMREEFDTIAFRGMSGALIAPIVAYMMDKQIMAIRKNTMDCHSVSTIESGLPVDAAARVCIIDDLIDRGSSMDAMRESIAENYPNATIVLIYLYNDWMLDAPCRREWDEVEHKSYWYFPFRWTVTSLDDEGQIKIDCRESKARILTGKIPERTN